jgi:hypothetical protein
MTNLMRRLLEDRWLVFAGLGAVALFASGAMNMRIAASTGLAIGTSVWLGLGFDTFWHWHKRHPDMRILASAFLMASLFGGEALTLTSGQFTLQGARALGVGIFTISLLLLTGAQIFGGKTPRTRDKDGERHTAADPHQCPENGKRV